MYEFRSTRDTPQKPENKPNYAFGVGIGFILIAFVLLGFPKFTGLAGVGTWIFYGLGLVVLIVGILGTCAEVFKR